MENKEVDKIPNHDKDQERNLPTPNMLNEVHMQRETLGPDAAGGMRGSMGI